MKGWFLLGLLLLADHAGIFILSSSLEPGLPAEEKQTGILVLVGLELFAGVVYLFAIKKILGAGKEASLLPWILAVGFALRGILFFSTPMLETDFYRFLWDGGVTAQAINPYRHSPNEVMDGTRGKGEGIPGRLSELAQESGEVLERINNSTLRTIYPPVAQGAFSLAYALKPWSTLSLRFVLFLFDVATLLLLLLILRTLKLPPVWIAVYWWSPLVLKEVLNACHMDGIILPFVLGSLFLAARRKPLWASFLLALAMGVKIWPVVLLPIVLRPLLRRPKKLALSFLMFALVVGILAVPILLAGLDKTSGFVAYGKSWERNDSLYLLFKWAAGAVLSLFESATQDTAKFAARIVSGVILFVCIFLAVRRPLEKDADFFRRSLFVVTSMFLLSPTQFPWYFLWILPFLVLRPKRSLLICSVLLFLYYMRNYMSTLGLASLFDHGMVWIQFVPVWILLFLEWRRR